MTEIQETPFEKLLTDVRSWDGRLASASALRERAAALGAVARQGTDEAERALVLVCSAYRKKRPGRLCIDPLKEPEASRIVGPFLGDPEMGVWPWADPLRIPDEEAIRWLPIVGRYAPADDPRVLEFVTMFFRLRRRDLWVPASRALAALAYRSERARDFLQTTWQECFPQGLPEAWPPTGLDPGKASGADGGEGLRHRKRHVLHAAAAWCSEDGDESLLEGFSAKKLVELSLPNNDADASAVLIALRELARERTRTILLPLLPARAREASAEEMGEQALRDLADDLREDPSAAGVVRELECHLREPHWQTCAGGKRLEALWSWLATARWFRSRGDGASLAEMKAVAKEGERALSWSIAGLPPETDAVEALADRLKMVLDEHLYETTLEPRRTAQIAELLLLLEEETLQKISWPALAGRAGGNAAAGTAREGTVKDAAKADLLVLFAERRLTPAFLIRGRELSEEDILRLSRSENGFVGRQMAVQLERLLREKSGEDQVKLLWRVFQRKPPADTFLELRKVLRGSDRALHELSGALWELDKVRRPKKKKDGDTPAPDLKAAPIYDRLCAAIIRVAGDSEAPGRGPAKGADAEHGTPKGRPFAERARGLATVMGIAARSDSKTEVGSRTWCQALRDVLVGVGSGEDGLEGWMKWLDSPIEGLRNDWEEFEAAVRRAHRAKGAISREESERLQSALEALKKRLSSLVWPENLVVNGLLAPAEEWAKARKEEARCAEEAADRVRRLRQAGDEVQLCALVANERALDVLPASEVQRLHKFLLKRILYTAAHRLHARVGERVPLPGIWTHLAPLFLGVAGGTLLVLDVGTAWNEVLLPGHRAGYLTTVLLGFVLSFVMLAGSLASIVTAKGKAPSEGDDDDRADDPKTGEGVLRRAARVCMRVLPTYLCAALLAGLVSSLTLWTLRGTSSRIQNGVELPFWPQVLLWSGLTLFLGLFLGLVLQGRSMAGDEE